MQVSTLKSGGEVYRSATRIRVSWVIDGAAGGKASLVVVPEDSTTSPGVDTDRLGVSSPSAARGVATIHTVDQPLAGLLRVDDSEDSALPAGSTVLVQLVLGTGDAAEQINLQPRDVAGLSEVTPFSVSPAGEGIIRIEAWPSRNGGEAPLPPENLPLTTVATRNAARRISQRLPGSSGRRERVTIALDVSASMLPHFTSKLVARVLEAVAGVNLELGDPKMDLWLLSSRPRRLDQPIAADKAEHLTTELADALDSGTDFPTLLTSVTKAGVGGVFYVITDDVPPGAGAVINASSEASLGRSLRIHLVALAESRYDFLADVFGSDRASASGEQLAGLDDLVQSRQLGVTAIGASSAMEFETNLERSSVADALVTSLTRSLLPVGV